MPSYRHCLRVVLYRSILGGNHDRGVTVGLDGWVKPIVVPLM